MHRATSTIWTFCNGGDLGNFITYLRDPLPPALVWHLLERSLNALNFLHYQCKPAISQSDLATRNIFLHWDDADDLPQVLLGDYGLAETLNLDDSSGVTVWNLMKQDYFSLYDIISTLIRRQTKAGAKYPSGLLTFLETFYAFQKDIEEIEGLNSQFKAAGNKMKCLLRDVRSLGKDCIAVYREQSLDLRNDRRVSPNSKPELGESMDVLMMMHPRPFGPFKIVEVQQETFEVLEVRKEIEGDFIP